MILCTAGQVLAAVLCAGHKCQTAVADVAVGRSLYLEKGRRTKTKEIYRKEQDKRERESDSGEDKRDTS